MYCCNVFVLDTRKAKKGNMKVIHQSRRKPEIMKMLKDMVCISVNL